MSRLTVKTAIANQSEAMEADTISKNGQSLKSQTSKGNFLRIALTITAVFFTFVSFAQVLDYEKAPKENEQVIGNVIESIYLSSKSADTRTQEAYIKLLEIARKTYPNKVIDLRNFKRDGSEGYNNCSAIVVETKSSETKMNETLVKAIDKAMANVRGGSRLAIDQISVSGGGLDRERVKDELIDVLLDRGYKIVAKNYLEKLQEEQEQQMSGNYNERTTAKIGNFSGVGYFLNVRVNEKSIRVQVVNVSTGEYEGNATVDF